MAAERTPRIGLKSRAEVPPKHVGWVRYGNLEVPVKRILQEENDQILVQIERVPGTERMPDEHWFTKDRYTSVAEREAKPKPPVVIEPAENDFIMEKGTGRSGSKLTPIDQVEMQPLPGAGGRMQGGRENAERKEYSQSIKEDLMQHLDTWSKRMVDAEIFRSPDMLAFSKAREEAAQLADRYADARTDDEQARIMQELTSKMKEFKGPLTDRLEELVDSKRPASEAPLPGETPEKLTPAENKKILRKSVKEISEIEQPKSEPKSLSKEELEIRAAIQANTLAAKAGVEIERASLTFALAAREDDLKAYLREEAAYKKIKKPTEAQKEEFEKIKKNHDIAKKAFRSTQLSYTTALQESMKARLEEKGWDKARAEAVAARYNRTIRLKEIVIPDLRQEQEIRKELQDEKGKSVFRRLVDWNRNLNERLERGITDRLLEGKPFGKKLSEAQAKRLARIGARATRVIGFTAAGLLAGTGIGALGGAASITAGAIGGRLGLSALSFTLGTGGGLAWGKWFALTKGARRAEEFGKLQREDIASAEDIERQKQAFLAGSAEAVEESRAVRENLVAALMGLGVSASAAINAGALESVRAAFRTVTGIFTGDQEAPTSPAGTPNAGGGNAAPPQASGANPNAAPPAGANSILVESTIDERGEGTDRLFRDLEVTVREAIARGNIRENSAVLNHFLQSHENVISREMGSAAYGERGIVTQPGDRFYFDSNQNLYYDPVNGEPQLFLQNDRSAEGGVRVHHLRATPLEPRGTSALEARTAPAGGAAEPGAGRYVEQSQGPPRTAPENGIPQDPGDTAGRRVPPETPPGAQPQTRTGGDFVDVQDFVNGGAQNESPAASEPAPAQRPPATRVPDTAPAVRGGGDFVPMQDFVTPPGIENPDAAAQPMSWRQGDPLPPTRAVFALQNQPDSVLVHAPTLEERRLFATQYGREHPGVRVYFDNSKSWLGTTTPQVGSMVFDRYSNLRDFTEQVIGQNGQAIASIGPDQLQERIV